jgi:hypothetical protein
VKFIQNDQIIKTAPLIRNEGSSYSSEPFDVPSGDFKIFVEGWDSNKNPIFREFTDDFTMDYEQGLKNEEKIEIENGVSQVIFTAVGKKPLIVYDSFNKKYHGRHLDDNSQTLIIDNPPNGIWTVHSEDGFSYSIRSGGFEEKTFEYGFSLEIPNSKNEISYQPIFGKSANLIEFYFVSNSNKFQV